MRAPWRVGSVGSEDRLGNMDSNRSKPQKHLGPGGKPKGTGAGSLKGKPNKATSTPRKSSVSTETRSVPASQPNTPRQSSVTTETRRLLAQPHVRPNQPVKGEVAAPADTAQPVDRLEAGWTLRDKSRPGTSQPQTAPTTSNRRTRPSKRQRRQARLRELKEQNAGLPAPSSKPVAPTPQPSTSRGTGGASTAGTARPKYKKGQKERGPLPDKAGGEAKPAVPSKRPRLNETNSPRGEYKRPKLLNRPPPTSFADAAKTNPLVAVTSATTGNICASSVQPLQKALEEKLMAAMLAAKGEEGPAFLGKPVFDEGVLKLWCSNLRTLEWLKEAVKDIVLPNGDRATVKQMWEIPRRVRCGILLPGVLTDTKAIGGMLRFQNPWAEVDRWLLHALYHHDDGTFVVVSVPEELVPVLMGHERRLAYMLGAVYLKFQGPTGKFTETAPLKASGQEEGSSRDTEATKDLPDPTPMQVENPSSDEPAAGNGAQVPEPPMDVALDHDSSLDLEDILSPRPEAVDDECTRELRELAIEDAKDEEVVLSEDGIPFN